jgi:hypothetical protein
LVNKIDDAVDPSRPKSSKVVKRSLDAVLKDIEKKSSDPGQDLRTPMAGGTKFPTNDSKDFSKKQLSLSQDKAEVGPAPLTAKLKPKGPTIQDITPRISSSTVGSLPKIGQAMLNDPLIQYLRKTAMELETDEDKKPQPEVEEIKAAPVTHEDPGPPAEAEKKGTNPHREYLKRIFSAKTGFRPKYEEKNQSPTQGTDKILQR